MKLLIILFALVVGMSCHTTKEGRNIRSKNTNSPLVVKNPDKFYLENRVSNCDSAIVYMKSVVVPGSLEVSALPELSARAYIRGESKQFLSRTASNTEYPFDNYRFYISLSCLTGQNAQVVYDIFIKPEYHKILWKTEKTANLQDGYYLDIKGLGGFGFRIAEGKVAFASANVYLEKQ